MDKKILYLYLILLLSSCSKKKSSLDIVLNYKEAETTGFTKGLSRILSDELVVSSDSVRTNQKEQMILSAQFCKGLDSKNEILESTLINDSTVLLKVKESNNLTLYLKVAPVIYEYKYVVREGQIVSITSIVPDDTRRQYIIKERKYIDELHRLFELINENYPEDKSTIDKLDYEAGVTLSAIIKKIKNDD